MTSITVEYQNGMYTVLLGKRGSWVYFDRVQCIQQVDKILEVVEKEGKL